MILYLDTSALVKLYAEDDIAQIKRRANRTGVGYTTLIRMILREHLRNPLVR